MASVSSLSDEELMLLYQDGEIKAFEELYRRHSGRVLGYLMKHQASKSEAEDLMQTVFLKVHQSRTRYDEKFPFLTWIFAITRNAMIDDLRKKRSFPTDSAKLEALVNEEGKDAQPEMGRDLAAAFESLSKDQREVLEMRFSEGLSFEEISKRSRTTQETVRKRVSRALMKVRKVFE